MQRFADESFAARNRVMRVLHVVTLISPDAAYGGPVSVARNQAHVLQSRGHEVVMASSARGSTSLSECVRDIPWRAFPARTTVPGIGFAGLRGSGMTRWIYEHATDFDVVHIHLARDFVTLPAARACVKRRVPLVLQTHGMIDHSSRLLAKPLDWRWTRPVLRAADAVLHLTPREEQDLRDVAGPLNNLRPLINGVPQAVSRATAPADGRPEVLFLARLAPRKRPEIFVEMAHRLIQEGSDANFAMVGPDEGMLSEVTALVARYGLGERLRYEGPLSFDQVVDRMSRASIYVLPSVGEPYAMTVVEAMSVGLPVVVTNTCGLAPLVDETRSGIVVGADLVTLTRAVRRILDDADLIDTMGENGRRTVANRLSMSTIADSLEGIYEQAVHAAGKR